MLHFINRDANPFFHLYEAFWMLDGGSDVRRPVYFNSKFGQYSDDGKEFNGAYGARWAVRDQIGRIVHELKERPESRRCVLQMWNVEQDLLKIDVSKDVCCNTACYFTMNDGKLDMTVTCRSNDLIWGLLGANVVHFSFLLEYVANRVGVPIGYQYHLCNDLHVYTDTNSKFDPDFWLEERPPVHSDPMPLDTLTTRELRMAADIIDFMKRENTKPSFESQFMSRVYVPMMFAYMTYKEGDLGQARLAIQEVECEHWRVAGSTWLETRYLNRLKKQEKAQA